MQRKRVRPIPKRELTNSGRVALGVIFGVPAFLLLLYILDSLDRERFAIGWGRGTRLDSTVNREYLAAPWEIALWAIFHFQLLFLLGAAAIKPKWLVQRKILVPGLLSLAVATGLIGLAIFLQ